jgi:hypothetical protein
VYRGLEDLTYPFHGQTIAVTLCGRICFKGRKVNLSHVFAGQNGGGTSMRPLGPISDASVRDRPF